MNYFIHGTFIAAVETEGQAEKYAVAGWRPVGRAAFMAAWQEKDEARLVELWEALPPVTRAVGWRLIPMDGRN